MSGALGGALDVGGERLSFSGGTGYHDHNWGFWERVTWQWGQVEHDGFSFVYGRVHPPADAADPERTPGFLAALGPQSPLGYSADVTIEETIEPASGQPRRILVKGRGPSLALTMDWDLQQVLVTRMPPARLRRRDGLLSDARPLPGHRTGGRTPGRFRGSRLDRDLPRPLTPPAELRARCCSPRARTGGAAEGEAGAMSAEAEVSVLLAREVSTRKPDDTHALVQWAGSLLFHLVTCATSLCAGVRTAGIAHLSAFGPRFRLPVARWAIRF